MWGSIIYAAILLGTYIYHRYIEHHNNLLPNAIGTPRVDTSAPVPLIYGRCRVRAPVLAFQSPQRTATAADQPVYFIDAVFVAGIPFFGESGIIRTVYVGDAARGLSDASFWPAPGTSPIPFGIPIFGSPLPARSNFFVRNPMIASTDVIGYGFVETHAGTATQLISDGIDDSDPDGLTDTQAVFEVEALNNFYNVVYGAPPIPRRADPSLIPAYRNMMIVTLYGWCSGGSNSIPSYSFEVESNSSMFTAPRDSGDADPAAVLFDLLTSPWAKLGLPTSVIDMFSFGAAAITLHAEFHGYSRAIEQDEEATAIIDDLLKQIDGTLYMEPSTGKLVLKLIRFDYIVDDLLDVNPDNTETPKAGWYVVQGWNETFNQVRLTFPDRVNNYADGLVLAQNPGNATSQNRLRSIDLRFPGVADRVTAQAIASRELAVVSRPMVKASVVVNRTFYRIRPGDVVTLTWPELGVDHMVMRVARVDLGQLHDNKVTLDLMQDIFDIKLGAYPAR